MLFESNIIDFLHWFPCNRVRHAKSEMRSLLVQKRRLLTADQVCEYSARVISRVEQLACFRQAKTVLLYYPLRNEVDLRPLLDRYADEKTILLPVTHRKHMDACPYCGEALMKPGRFHILEPQTPPYKGMIDIVLVPGVAFDRRCNRLGRGGGYYDRFLSHRRGSVLVGVAFDFQLVERVPTRFFDKRLDMVISPSQTIAR